MLLLLLLLEEDLSSTDLGLSWRAEAELSVLLRHGRFKMLLQRIFIKDLLLEVFLFCVQAGTLIRPLLVVLGLIILALGFNFLVKLACLHVDVRLLLLLCALD